MNSGSSVGTQSGLEKYKPFTILIVDDDPVFRQLVNRLLSKHGYNVLEARSTIEAEPLLRTEPDLLIVDYRMPATNGDVWIKKLRDRGINVPIVFCSASTYSSPVHDKIRNVLQVDLIVRKPIEEGSFVRQLQSLLPRRSQENQEVQSEEAEPLITDTLAYLFDHDTGTYKLLPVEQDALTYTGETSLFLPKPLPKTVSASLEPPPKTVADTLDTSERSKTKSAMRDLATLYLTELPAISQLLREELTDSREHNVLGVLENAAGRAHKMKGAAGSLGFTEIQILAGQVEDCLKEAASPIGSGEHFDYTLLDQLMDSLDRSIHMAQDGDGAKITVEAKPLWEPSDSGAVPRFLILSNDASESLALASLLNGYNSALTRSLRDAMSVFSMLEDYRPDLLFIDTALMGTSGYDICRMIRCNPIWSSLPIVFLAEDCSAECRARMFESGGHDFIVKPANETELIMRVGSLLNWAK